jgi:hypothetical protein
MHEDDVDPGAVVEQEPGVIVERRSLLASLGALALTAGLGTRARSEEAMPALLTYDDFLRAANPLAKRLVADTTLAGQDTYLHSIAALAVRLAGVPVPELRDSGQGAGPGTFIGANPGGESFTVLHWKMAPGSEIRRHAHTYGNVVTIALEGEVRVENFEMVGPRDFTAPGTFKVRRTVDQWLTAGGANLVSLERNYIHGSRAGRSGARGLDITTRLREKRPTPYLDIGGRAPDADGLLEAAWTV